MRRAAWEYGDEAITIKGDVKGLKLNEKKTKHFPVYQGLNAIGYKIYTTKVLFRIKAKKILKMKTITKLILEEYNILIINSAMQEGWDLIDDKVDLAILDTTDITEQIQDLRRIRKDIDLVIKKTNELNKEILTIKVPEE